jgi:carboxyl-terminal processing protease
VAPSSDVIVEAMRTLAVLSAGVFALGCIADNSTALAPRSPVSPASPSSATADEDEGPSIPVGPLPAGAYNLGQLPVLSKVLFYVRENYFDRSRFNYRGMALGALEFVQRDVPEVVVERLGRDQDQVKVSVGGNQAVFSLQRVDAPWNLRSTLQRIFQFVQANLAPLPPEAEGRHLLEIETAAVNGMLYTLDPHSVLLDPATYAGMYRRSGDDDLSASIGLILEVDASGRIAVVDVVPGSPAASAGIAAGDRILRLDGDAAQNMTLDEIVNRLRGPADSKIDLAVERDGRRTAQRLTLVRAPVLAVGILPPPRLLSDKIGYFHLQRLVSGSSLEVHEALRAFASQGATGVVMDLCGNSGGLYAEAHKVADEFVDQGTIVSMVGVGGSRRKDETATGTAPTPQLPLVVLVDHQTASGAEVIAAAMKNLDRGVVIGEPTFGMGSVQVLFDIPSPLARGPDEIGGKLGLKLTTAQMLAAGGAPLQGWGVFPDIPAVLMAVSADGSPPSVQLQPSRNHRSERDYERSLPPASRPRLEPPAAAVPYLQETVTRGDDDRQRLLDPETDPLTLMARGLLHQAKGFARHQLLATSDQFLAGWRAEQDRRLSAALDRRGVDWTSGPPGPPPPLQLTLERLAPSSSAVPQEARIRGVVKNVGTTPAFRVRAVIESDHPGFDDGELVFGKIAPGKSKSYDLSIGTPPNAASAHAQTALLHATLLAQDRPLRQTVDLLVEVAGAPQSTLSLRYQIREGAKGSNHDGRIERGERVEIPVTVTNTGSEALRRVRANLLSRQSGPRVMIPAGRFELGALEPGASKTATFAAVTSPSFGPDHCDLRIEIEPDSGDSTWHPVRIDLSGLAPNIAASAAGPTLVKVNPPRLTVRGPAVATTDTVRIEGTASGEQGVHDLYIRVWNRNLKIPVRKVFYQLNSPADSPEMSFQADVPVTRGTNLIQVFARQSVEATSMRTVMVLRAPTATPGRSADQP